MNSTDMKAELACYLRFVRQYRLVFVEQLNQDIIAVDGRRRVLWVEIKISIGDLLNDRRKMFHQSIRLIRELPLFGGRGAHQAYKHFMEAPHAPARFFFAVPHELAEKAHKKIIQHFPWAGLLSVKPTPVNALYLGHNVEVLRKAEHIHDRKLAIKSAIGLIKCQSASLAHAYARLSRRKA